MTNRLLPLAAVMAVATVYLVTTGILSLRHRRPYAPVLERALIVVPTVLVLFIGFQLTRSIRRSPSLIPGQALLTLIFVGLLIGDLRILRSRPSTATAWRKRHLLRMMLALGFATTAVLNINGGRLGIPLELTVILPLLLALALAGYFIRQQAQPART